MQCKMQPERKWDNITISNLYHANIRRYVCMYACSSSHWFFSSETLVQNIPRNWSLNFPLKSECPHQHCFYSTAVEPDEQHTLTLLLWLWWDKSFKLKNHFAVLCFSSSDTKNFHFPKSVNHQILKTVEKLGTM